MHLAYHRRLPNPLPSRRTPASRASRRWISDHDHAKLTALLNNPNRDARTEWSYTRLREILQQARIVPAAQLPTGTAQLDSICTVSGERLAQPLQFTVTLPAEADPTERRFSVLSPLGLAVLGRQQGQECPVAVPGGLKNFRLVRVAYRLLQAASPDVTPTSQVAAPRGAEPAMAGATAAEPADADLLAEPVSA